MTWSGGVVFREQTLIYLFSIVLNTFKSTVCLLLGKEATEGAIAVFTLFFSDRLAAFANVACIWIEMGLVPRVGFVFSVALNWLIGQADRNVFSLYVKQGQLFKVIDQQVAKSYAFVSLLESIFVSVNLGKNCAELHSQPAYDAKLAHSIADWLFFKPYGVNRHLL